MAPPKIEISNENWDKIFEDITRSHKSVMTICEDNGFCFRTVWRRINKSKRLCQRYERAKSEQSDYLVEHIFNRIEDGYNKIEDQKYDNKRLMALMQCIKIDTDTLKWLTSKLKPTKYGDRIEQLIKGDANNPLKVTFSMPTKRDKSVSKKS